jgi:hypothetical protein
MANARGESTVTKIDAYQWLMHMTPSFPFVHALIRMRSVPGLRRAYRRLACDCAERVLPILEARHPGDYRAREVILRARAFAAGHAPEAPAYAASALLRAAPYYSGSFAAWACWYGPEPNVSLQFTLLAACKAKAAMNPLARIGASCPVEYEWQKQRFQAWLQEYDVLACLLEAADQGIIEPPAGWGDVSDVERQP